MNNQTPANSSSSEIAPVIEGFRILERLGHGATSSVWKAEQVSLNRLVVIKVLSERLTHEPEDVTLFKAEARMAANFKHAGIVQVYDFGQSVTSRCYYFVMEYISGYSVGDWIRRKGKIAEADALVVVHAVADAMKYAWDLSKIVHCDIKPDNIMVDGDGSVKVADLGLAHTVKSMTNQPGANADEVIITGTPNYMAPEQVRGTEAIDCRTDIYALGASLYHMATGQLPFADSPPDVVLERQLKEVFEYPQKVNPDLSVSATRLIVKMTAKEPAARFQTWDEVLAEVVRLERQMRQKAAAFTQPAAGAVGTVLSGRTPVADSKNYSALTGTARWCMYCGKPIQPNALYCGFCGKPTVVPPQEPVEDQKQNTIRLKPIDGNPSAGAKPAALNLKLARSRFPSNNNPVAAPEPWPSKAPRRWYKSFGSYVRMLLTLCLLAFLGYYAYQKYICDNDVLVPVKEAIIEVTQPALEEINAGLQEGEQWSLRLIWARLTKPKSPDGLSTVAPEEMAAPDKTIESSESRPAQGVESLPAAETTVPEVNKTATPGAQAPWETPSPTPAASEPPKPEPSVAPAKPLQDVEYERILQTCKQQQPKAGDQIVLRFTNGREPVTGAFEQATADGVRIKVPAGVIEYPFRLMSEESRLMHFPEERARRLQRQKTGQAE
ncbi:MAG: protein kinase [Kiritimatiellae bacterium]|nr:protein kinase [Kiritimatiellia bacterium]